MCGLLALVKQHCSNCTLVINEGNAHSIHVCETINLLPLGLRIANVPGSAGVGARGQMQGFPTHGRPRN